MKKYISKITSFIKEYVAGAGAKGAVVGMSGGKDSFVVAKLCSLALGAENVFGVILPNGEMKDLEIAKHECEILGIKSKVVNIENIDREIKALTKEATDSSKLNEVSAINIAPRVRMTVLYAVAANLNYLVANTSNLSETMIGYSTKWGDNVGDFAPIADFTKTEVCEIGLALGLPKEYVLKAPTDGLSGKKDEEKIGFSYSVLDEFIRTGKSLQSEEKIKTMNRVTAHKRALPPKCDSEKKNFLK